MGSLHSCSLHFRVSVEWAQASRVRASAGSAWRDETRRGRGGGFVRRICLISTTVSLLKQGGVSFLSLFLWFSFVFLHYHTGTG